MFDCSSQQTHRLREFSPVHGRSFSGKANVSLLHREQIFPVCLPEIYTIQGNSQGNPCYFPFLYDGQWFHNCTSTGREDGHLWCATTHDYGKDERWGFCPVKSEERFAYPRPLTAASFGL